MPGLDGGRSLGATSRESAARATEPLQPQGACDGRIELPGLPYYRHSRRPGRTAWRVVLYGLPRHDQKGQPAIQTLTAFAGDRKPIPWVRVYKLPGFVYFSHQVHYKEAHVECAVCHGPVAERTVIRQETSTAMADCMKCHDQQQAANGCDL